MTHFYSNLLVNYKEHKPMAIQCIDIRLVVDPTLLRQRYPNPSVSVQPPLPFTPRPLGEGWGEGIKMAGGLNAYILVKTLLTQQRLRRMKLLW